MLFGTLFAADVDVDDDDKGGFVLLVADDVDVAAAADGGAGNETDVGSGVTDTAEVDGKVKEVDCTVINVGIGYESIIADDGFTRGQDVDGGGAGGGNGGTNGKVQLLLG